MDRLVIGLVISAVLTFCVWLNNNPQSDLALNLDEILGEE